MKYSKFKTMEYLKSMKYSELKFIIDPGKRINNLY